MKRRAFLRGAGAVAAGAMLRGHRANAFAAAQETEKPSIGFTTSDSACQSRYQSALGLLARNILTMPGYAKPLLIEGSSYRGVWLECGPHEGLAYSLIRPDIARNNHAAFFELQREDGQLPCNVKTTETGHGHIQMVVPIAATAWELAQQTQDEQLAAQAYAKLQPVGWLAAPLSRYAPFGAVRRLLHLRYGPR